MTREARTSDAQLAKSVSCFTQTARSLTPPSLSECKANRVVCLTIAEKSTGSRRSLILLRWALAVIFLWFGGMKFTSYEADAIAPFIAGSPIMSWLHLIFGVQGASYVIGVIELSTAVALIVGAFDRFASALGAAMSCLTYVITLTFFLTTPGVAEQRASGFPAISAPIGQFLLKDLVLLAASLCLLSASVQTRQRSPAVNGAGNIGDRNVEISQES